MAKDIGFMPETDGIDHINIYSKGKTALGQVLSNFWMCEIETEDGTFWSVEAYWAWLSVNELCNKRNDLRAKMSGWAAKQRGHQLVAEYGKRFEPRFEEKIMGAIRYKINRFKPLIKPFIKDLPFVHYYCWGDANKGFKKVDVTAKYQWMIDGIRDYCMEILNEKEIKEHFEGTKEVNSYGETVVSFFTHNRRRAEVCFEESDKTYRFIIFCSEKETETELFKDNPIKVDDCTICEMAIHQHLLSCTKHTCVQGMSEKEFRSAMDNADCWF